MSLFDNDVELRRRAARWNKFLLGAIIVTLLAGFINLAGDTPADAAWCFVMTVIATVILAYRERERWLQ